jgi:chromosome partitioning protein
VQAAASLGVAVARLRSAGHDLLIVDTPPAADRIVAAAVAAADIVVVPVRPSPDDLDAVGETVDLVTTAGRPMVFVVNSATRKARLTADAAIALSQHGTVCPSIIHRADIFAASALDGRTVAEVEPGGKPAYEIDGLWTYVAGKVGMTAAKKTPIVRSAKATLKVVDSSPDERIAG